MLASYKTFLACFLIGLLIAFLITPLVRQLAFKLKAIDLPGERSQHKKATPLLGGIAIFVGMWIPLGLLSFWENDITQRLAKSSHLLISIFMAGLVMILVGIVDDRRGLSAKVKFAAQLPLAVLLVLSGIEFGNLTIPGVGSVPLGFLGPVLTVLWIVGVTNALNLIDGIDGLATGVAFFVAITNGMIAVMNGNDLLAVVMFSMAGASLGFLRYNFNPAQIFLGDTGSLFLGITLATSSVAASAKSTVAVSMFLPILVLGYPVLDTLVVMSWRKVRGRQMFSADRGHLHHRLLAKGLSQRKVVLGLYGLCGLFCLIGFGAVVQNLTLVVVGLIVLCALLLFGFGWMGFSKILTERALNIERPVFQIIYHFTQYTKLKLDLAVTPDEVVNLVRGACEQFHMERLELFVPDGKMEGLTHLSLDRKDKFIARARRETNIVTKKLAHNAFEFPDTGFVSKVYYLKGSFADDLQLEYQLLLKDIFDRANLRLKKLLPESDHRLSPDRLPELPPEVKDGEGIASKPSGSSSTHPSATPAL